MQTRGNTKGYTLIEMLIAMAMAGIVMTAIYTAYRSQNKSYAVQTEVAAMQQNMRTALYYIERELRLAGCDPTGNAGAGFVTADASTLRFTMDLTGGESDGKDNDGDGTVDESDEDIYPGGTISGDSEDVTYALADNDGDGDMDLERNNNLIAENIDAINFVYFDEDSNQLATPVADPSDIRYVQVTIVARTDPEDIDYSNTTTYLNRQNDTLYTANDHRRRDMLYTIIKTRNMGI